MFICKEFRGLQWAVMDLCLLCSVIHGQNYSHFTIFRPFNNKVCIPVFALTGNWHMCSYSFSILWHSKEQNADHWIICDNASSYFKMNMFYFLTAYCWFTS